ncbi:hypothetical protein [Arenicella xantha]|uniref:Uncharacterized protein n=1 Tax=Arenicella xantha TaxID=644221 RepID=A0A395JI68_9GAMM|nr:hypothetical protein [Arenicella xantha]RBP49776.1 hypothetical protein DFR28_103201 [Arenicella xantha]
MNYVVSYWAPDDMASDRRDALRRYFDLQHYTKTRFGGHQIILTNIDYPSAIQLQVPTKFSKPYAMFAKYLGLGQMVRAGLEFPIALHDHDMFIRTQLPVNDTAIQCCSGSGSTFSDQLVVFPECSKDKLMAFIERLESFDFPLGFNAGYGCEVRHEEMFSTEVAAALMDPPPFAGMRIEVNIPFRDIVSFDILEHHSLDVAQCECQPISSDAVAVHAHINKGPATDALIDWLAAD